ncbi:TetR/AcrR family transcriptional regulator [Actinacidiphila yeochonensis]|uniref:TetR/AcrR family transcriptional regulator n=1 Tax=Actinacidiphila yeochonensis TaxID=89050 RepID=UPI00055B8B79|nr:TetR/AcrR family transcriptional regulator [Actinacidiphila yeochonensis]
MPRTGRPREFDLDEALDAALLVFWEHGYEATSVGQLREATGLSSGSIYGAFSSKQGLFEAVVERYATTFGQVTGPASCPDLAPREAVELTLRQSVLMQTDTAHPRGCLLVSSGAPARPEDRQIRELLSERRSRDRRNLIACVRRGIDLGELPADLDAEALGSAFHTFLVGISTQALDGVQPETLDTAVGYLMGLWDLLAEPQRSAEA